jgi:hypothetical protein
MSNALAIATVTETLLSVLNATIPNYVSGASATATRPDDTTQNTSSPRVNIFLYQVTPNPAFRNSDLPTRAADGSAVHRPQIGLDLHYLLTFYGDDGNLEQQRLLGAVVRLLHAAPTLRRADISNTVTSNSAILAGSNLAEQTELVRFTPINFSLEELSKLWSVFLKTDYVLSVAYVASVVLIETDEPPPADALPVRKRRVKALPLTLPIIDSVTPQAVAGSPPTMPQIQLVGRALDPGFTASFTTPGSAGPLVGTIESGSNGTALTVTLPSGLRPGLNSVQLLQTAGGSPSGNRGPQVLAQSNAAPFLLLPDILSVGAGSPAEEIVMQIWPAAGPQQQVSLLLNLVTPSSPPAPQAFLLNADARSVETDTFTFQTRSGPNAPNPWSVPVGLYLVRVRVDAAESRLTVGTSGAYEGPTVVI